MGDAGPTDDDTEYNETGTGSTDDEQPDGSTNGDHHDETKAADARTDDDQPESAATDDHPDGPTGDGEHSDRTTSRAQRERDVVTRDELQDLQETLDEFEDEIEGRTVHRDELEQDLKQYVRARVRRGHASGWGPYLVLLYGTVMTLGAFYFLGGGWAVLAMFVVWLSTLGLYTLMVLVGVTVKTVGLPGRAIGKLRNLR